MINQDHRYLFIVKDASKHGGVIYATTDAEEAYAVFDKWCETHRDEAEVIELRAAPEMGGWKPVIPPERDLE